MTSSVDSLTLFKLLSDETRLAVVLLIHQQEELCVCEFTQALELSQPKISRHLAMLREAGVLATRRSGKWVHYSLAPDLPNEASNIIENALSLSKDKIEVHLQRLNAMGGRPEREKRCC